MLCHRWRSPRLMGMRVLESCAYLTFRCPSGSQPILLSLGFQIVLLEFALGRGAGGPQKPPVVLQCWLDQNSARQTNSKNLVGGPRPSPRLGSPRPLDVQSACDRQYVAGLGRSLSYSSDFLRTGQDPWGRAGSLGQDPWGISPAGGRAGSLGHQPRRIF